MIEDDEQLEAEAKELFNCDKKGLLDYLVTSAGSIGPSKLSKNKTDTTK
jgi:hypothetical protein